MFLAMTGLAFISWVLCGVEAATFNDWHTVNQDSLSTSEYKIDPILNSFCSAYVDVPDVDCEVPQIGMLVKWFFALECTRHCNQDNCMDDLSGLAVTCRFDEADNDVTKETPDLLWSASCTCPTASTHSGSQKEIMLASMSQMKRVYDEHSCSAELGSEVSKLSVCGKTNGKSLQEWIDSHPGTNFDSSGFNITEIPNLLCLIAAETKGENCDSTASLLPQWYFSQKCMEKCHGGRCADFGEMHVNCYSVPANNEENYLCDFAMSAQCVCPECTVNSGAINVIAATSLQEMLDEYRRLMCPDPTALIQTAALACNSAEAARIIDGADSCGDGPVPFCDKYAECVTYVNGTEVCQCKEGYTGSGYDCIKVCEVEAIDNAETHDSSGVAIAVGAVLEETESMTVSCNVRSRLIGDSVVECGCGGFVDLPACKPECDSPVADPNGAYVHLDSSVPTFPVLEGTVLTLNCSDGYYVSGSDRTMQCEPDGSFNTTGLICEEKCSTIPSIQNGIFETSNGIQASGEYPVGATLLAKCDSGFVLVNSNRPAIVCQSSETWNPNTMICAPACTDDSDCSADAGCDYYYDPQRCTDYCETGSKIGECWCASNQECYLGFQCINNRCTGNGVCSDDSICRPGTGCYLANSRCLGYCTSGSKSSDCWCASDPECHKDYDCTNNECVLKTN